MSKKDTIILIGMPGSGKSTVGVVLAKAMGCRFLDSDLLIQEVTGKLLYEIIRDDGLEFFQSIEEQVNSEIVTDHAIIATGGSVVYGKRAMEHFKQMGTIIYLKVSLESIAERLGSLTERGVAIKDGYSLSDLYEERRPLYEMYADIIIDEGNLSIRETVKYIKEKLKR